MSFIFRYSVGGVHIFLDTDNNFSFANFRPDRYQKF